MPDQLQLPFGAPERAVDIFARVFRRLHPRKPMPAFQVEYCEWAQLRSTIRVREAGIEVRISDILLGVSPAVLEALAEILLSRLDRQPPSRDARACYLSCVLSPAIRQRAEAVRRTRGFKLMLPARGKQFNLDEIFADLNAKLFKGLLPRVNLGWSMKRSRTILGHHDPAHGAITISRILDSPRAPRALVEFIVYHEMLHVHFPVERNHHRRIIHSREFHEAEKRFPEYDRARRLLRSGHWGK
ncbi:MAG: SprT-like domain-containing protein, partial [Terriglobia bacterium]